MNKCKEITPISANNELESRLKSRNQQLFRLAQKQKSLPRDSQLYEVLQIQIVSLNTQIGEIKRGLKL